MFKELLKTKNITQTALSKKLNVSQVLISKWMNGKCQPQLQVVPALAKALGVTNDDIIDCFKTNQSQQ